jgi:hypothetical protein
MTVAKVVSDYVHQLTELGTALNKLHQMTADTDENSAPLLVRNIHEETLEIIGWHVASLDAAHKVLAALERQNDWENARHSLGSCNKSFLEMFNRFYKDLFTAHHITDLEKLKGKKGTEHWAHTTLSDLYSCQLAIQKVCAILLSSWEIMVETSVAQAVTPNSTSIGQQFLFPGKK